MASKKTGGSKKTPTPQQLLAEVVKEKGSARAVADEMKAAGYRSSQQSVDAWVKGLWPPRPATQDALKKLYKIPAPWSRA